MTNLRNRQSRQRYRLVLVLAGMACAGVATTAELSWSPTVYSHYSNQEPLRDVLESLASSQSLPVVVSDNVQDVISVSFTEMLAGDIFERLISAYKLTWYFDGNAIYVYRIDEVQSSVIKLKSISPIQFQESLTRLGIFDPRFQWNVEEEYGLVYFSGPPRFVVLVNEMAKRLDIGKPVNQNTVYTWVDQYGTTHYSSEPPPLDYQSKVFTIPVRDSAITTDAETAGLTPMPSGAAAQ